MTIQVLKVISKVHTHCSLGNQVTCASRKRRTQFASINDSHFLQRPSPMLFTKLCVAFKCDEVCPISDVFVGGVQGAGG